MPLVGGDVSDRAIMFIVWGFGVILVLLSIPFLPRQEVRTPIRAVGTAIILGAIWPLLLLVALGRYAPWWYWLKWVEYREFLIEAETARLEQEFRNRWYLEMQEQYPEAYQRNRERLEFDLGNLNKVERVKGIEPSYAAWEAAVLPLNYTREE